MPFLFDLASVPVGHSVFLVDFLFFFSFKIAPKLFFKFSLGHFLLAHGTGKVQHSRFSCKFYIISSLPNTVQILLRPPSTRDTNENVSKKGIKRQNKEQKYRKKEIGGSD